MGGLLKVSQRLHDNYFGGNKNLRQVAFPVTGAGAGTGLGAVCTSGAALTWGAWQDVALPALITVESLVVAISLDTPSVLETYSVQLGSTNSLGVNYANAAAVIAAGAAAIAGAFRAEVARMNYLIVGAAGYVVFATIPIKFPIWYGPGHGVLARISTISGADTLNVSVHCLQNF